MIMAMVFRHWNHGGIRGIIPMARSMGPSMFVSFPLGVACFHGIRCQSLGVNYFQIFLVDGLASVILCFSLLLQDRSFLGGPDLSNRVFSFGTSICWHTVRSVACLLPCCPYRHDMTLWWFLSTWILIHTIHICNICISMYTSMGSCTTPSTRDQRPQ